MPCEPPRLGRREARDLLANKTVAFVGDSVSRMMFCETAAWLFGVKGWWWQNRWVPGRSTWSPSLWNNSGAIIAAGCGFGNLLDCRNAPDGVACTDNAGAAGTPYPRCAACNRFAAHLRPHDPARPTKVSEKIRAKNAYGDTVWIPYGVASADGEGERDAPCADATVGGVRLAFVWQRHLFRAAQPKCALASLLVRAAAAL